MEIKRYYQYYLHKDSSMRGVRQWVTMRRGDGGGAQRGKDPGGGAEGEEPGGRFGGREEM